MRISQIKLLGVKIMKNENNANLTIKENINNLLNFMQSSQDLNTNKVFQHVEENFKSINFSEEGTKRAFYGNQSGKLWLGNGFYIEKHFSHDTFNGMTAGVSNISLNNILTNKYITIYNQEEFYNGKQRIVEQDLIANDEKEKKELFNYIDTFSQTITKENIIKYIEKNDINYYQLLDKSLKVDEDIIKSVVEKIYDNSYWQYDEIVEWDRISPYGGEDISYFPKSSSHCFMDNLENECKGIGIYQFCSKEEVKDLAYSIMINKDDKKYLDEQIEQFEKKAEVLPLKRKILDFVNKNEDVLYFANNDEAYEDYCFYIDSKKQKESWLNENIPKLETLKNKKYNWFEKNVTKRKQYQKDAKDISNLSQEIEDMKEALRDLIKDNAKVFKDKARYEKYRDSFYKDNALNKLFKLNNYKIPDSKQEVKDCLNSYGKYIRKNKKEYIKIKTMIKKHEKNKNISASNVRTKNKKKIVEQAL